MLNWVSPYKLFIYMSIDICVKLEQVESQQLYTVLISSGET